MSNFLSVPPAGKGRKNMTIEQALTIATKGGYHIRGSDGIDTSYEGASNEYSAWTRNDNHSTFMVTVEETFLDPVFWQALGHALGWDHKLMTVHAMENGRPTMVTKSQQHWLAHWHRFIDHLAEGKDAASFFASLALPVVEENVSANVP
jgi:hypothetical protein